MPKTLVNFAFLGLVVVSRPDLPHIFGWAQHPWCDTARQSVLCRHETADSWPMAHTIFIEMEAWIKSKTPPQRANVRKMSANLFGTDIGFAMFCWFSIIEWFNWFDFQLIVKNLVSLMAFRQQVYTIWR